MLRARIGIQRRRRAGVAAALHVRHFAADHRRAEILVRGNVDHAGLRVEGRGRPVLSAPPRRAEVGHFAGARFFVWIDIGTSGLRIESAIDVVPHERRRFDEFDRAGRALEEIQNATARDVDQSLDRAAAALEVDQNRRRHLVPVPRFIRVVLHVALDLTRRDIDGHRRGDVQVVAGPSIADPRTTVAGAPVRTGSSPGS